jgi:sugar phosphate isomerase/epimerase
MTKTTVYASTSSLAGQYTSLIDLLTAFETSGVENVELGWTPPVGKLSIPRDLLKFSKRWLVHNYFPRPQHSFVLNLASQNLDLLKQSRDFCKAAICITKELGAPFYSVHSGFLGDFQQENLGAKLVANHHWDYERCYSTFLSSLKILIKEADNVGLSILVEPNVVARNNLVGGKNKLLMIAEASEIIRMYKDLSEKNFGILLDLGHLKVTAKTLGFDINDFINSIAPIVGALHVHDNDSEFDQHLPIEDNSWALNICTDSRFKGLPIINEAKFSSIDEMVSHCSWLEKKLDLNN